MATKSKLTPEQLVDQLVAAKKAEAEANKQRVQIEEQIIALFGNREEGAETHELGNGLKVTITGKLTYKANMEQLMQICGALPANMRPLKVETKLDETGAKFLKNNEPEVWAMLAKAITVSPAKTAVTIKA